MEANGKYDPGTWNAIEPQNLNVRYGNDPVDGHLQSLTKMTVGSETRISGPPGAADA